MSQVYFPPGVECFHPDGNGAWNSSAFQDGQCEVTPDMIDFLNLTSITSYMNAYCLNPARDDNCPFGFCPNPDIAGPLVRISTYVITLCISLLVFYSPDDVKDAFWSQVLTIYSLILTAGIAIVLGELTKFHAVTVSVIVASPLTIYFVVYSIRASWGGIHRLENVLGRKHLFRRLFILLAAAIWIAFTIYPYLQRNASHFAQTSCRTQPLLLSFFLLTPISVGIMERHRFPWLGPVIAGPFLLIVLAWVIAIIRKRRIIWPSREPYRFNFWKTLTVVSEHYPFIYFISIVVIPFVYWVACIEIGVFDSNDNQFTLTFGQVLALFVTIPPILQVSKLAPRLFYWFYDLTWLRRIDGGRSKSRPSSIYEGGTSLLDKPGKLESRYSLDGSDIQKSDPYSDPYDPRPSQSRDRSRYTQL
ncbi:hypothetical protein BJ322DRAFT_1046832 [Thelephora terrestris]|uniref:Uncharacterized protein n=1 Tax=Thelephora terrestris TaxID=56493 RepID=A0A9P6HJ92_9AGAM|nr:hypothetical protein BJ322DRAFT_1046832 [Thelephora terrestris]